MWNFDPITSESRKWSNEELQGREAHAKESHKDNSLSEKAAKKIHQASNCELHKTKFKQLIADVYMTFQRIRRWGCSNALTQLEMTIRGEPELRFKIPHKGIIQNQKESMPRETEKH